MSVHAHSLQSCLTLCNSVHCSLPGSSVHGILQGRVILEWVAFPFSRGSSQPRDWTQVSCSCCIAGRFFTTKPLGKPTGAKSASLENLVYIKITSKSPFVFVDKCVAGHLKWCRTLDNSSQWGRQNVAPNHCNSWQCRPQISKMYLGCW